MIDRAMMRRLLTQCGMETMVIDDATMRLATAIFAAGAAEERGASQITTDKGNWYGAFKAAQADNEKLRNEIKQMLNRIERLRGILKTNAGWWYELSDDDKGDACMEAAGDMEPPLAGANA